MSTPTVRIQTFPNEEVRAVFYYARDKKQSDTPVLLSGSKSPLDITSKLETPSPDEYLYSETTSLKGGTKPGYGVPGEGKGFSTNGRRRMMRAGAVLDELADYPEQILFATGTLPGSTYEAKLAIAAWSGWAVHAMKAWFAKRVPAKMDMYVWEFQKRGALHLHYAILVKDTATRKRLLVEWKPQWKRIIDGIGEKAGVDMWRKNANFTHADNKEVLQADIQECTKSIARYLSKYVSKSQQQYLDNHWKKCKPSRFWGISRPLCAALTAKTETFEHSFESRMAFEAGYEDILSVSQSWAKVSYSYDIPDVNARVIVSYANAGERTWLSRNMAAQLSSKEKSLMSNQSEQDRLCLSISHYLQKSKMLREQVLSFSDERYLQWAITTGLSESEFNGMKTQLILDFQWYICHLIQNRPYVPDGLKFLGRRLTRYSTENLGISSSPTPAPLPAEQSSEKLEELVPLQLTILG